MENIYDVALSGIPFDGRAPVDNTVNVAWANDTNDVSAADLQATWADPDLLPSKIGAQIDVLARAKIVDIV